MGLDDDIAVLAAAPLFRFFGQDALRLLSFASERRDLAAGEILFRRGDPCDGGYVVVSGTLEVAPRVAGADPVVVGRSGLVGQLALLLPGERPSEARAGEAATVLRVSPTVMRRVLEEFPAAAAAIHDDLADDLAALSDGLARVGGLFAE